MPRAKKPQPYSEYEPNSPEWWQEWHDRLAWFTMQAHHRAMTNPVELPPDDEPLNG